MLCRRPGCGQRFTASRTWQKYCSARCRNAQQAKRLARGGTGLTVLNAALAWFQAGGDFTHEARLRDACEAHALVVKQEEET